MGKLRDLISESKVLVLDGALGTELEYQGYDVSGSLWSAKYLLNQPEIIQKIHQQYVLAGSDIITTASYQASVPALMELGRTKQQALQVIASTVQISKDAIQAAWDTLGNEEKKNRIYPLVGASIGPYAAYLADGSEYTGIYHVVEDDLIAFHRPRLEILAEAGADFFAIETIPNYVEVKVLLQLLAEFPDMDAYISFTSQDGKSISDGTPIEDVVTLCEQVPNLVAIGLNCTSPRHIYSLLEKMRKVTERTFVVYPNSGEIYDGFKKVWYQDVGDSLTLSENYLKWQAFDVGLIGGCCRTRPADIRDLRKTVESFRKDY